MKREQIREIFLANGFTIKPGNDDLKEYVYAAAEALLAAQHKPHTSAAHDIVAEQHRTHEHVQFADRTRYVASIDPNGGVKPYPHPNEYHLGIDKVTAPVAKWNYDMSACPRGVKCLLLNAGGVAVFGPLLAGEDEHFFLAWSPLPQRDKEEESRRGLR